MFEYESKDIDERKLEDMVRRAPHLIEGGLKFVDHQKRTARGPLDVLLVDSGHALIIAELKTQEDDGMLVQALDYFDYVSANLDGFARIYKQFNIDVMQLRLFLIAPSFSQTLLNRCKWIDQELKISLFTYKYIITTDTKEDTIVFMETKIPSRPKREEEYSIPKLLDYIKDDMARKSADRFLEEVKSWNPEAVEVAPRKYKVVVNISGSKIAKKVVELWPGRKYWDVDVLDLRGNEWREFRIHSGGNYNEPILLLQGSFKEAGVEFTKLKQP